MFKNIRLPLDFCSNNLGLLSVTPFYHHQLHSLLCDRFVLESFYIWIQVWFWPPSFFQFDISWRALFGIQSFGWKKKWPKKTILDNLFWVSFSHKFPTNIKKVIIWLHVIPHFWNILQSRFYSLKRGLLQPIFDHFFLMLKNDWSWCRQSIFQTQGKSLLVA